MKIERRYILAEDLEIRKKDAEKTKLVGYAAKFNQLSENLGGFREKVSPGAFSKTIKTNDVRSLWNHDRNYVLGRKSAGTLTLEEDDKGLKIENIPPETQWARDLMVSVERRDVKEMSFGFVTVNDTWEIIEGENIRTLLEVSLFDVSPVTFPAYPSTEIQARSLYLNNAGINFDALEKILIKVEHRLGDLVDDDVNIIKTTTEKLNDLISKKVCLPDDLAETNDFIFGIRSKLFDIKRRGLL